MSFLIGGAIRYTVIESARAGHTIGSIEGLSHLVLAGAYFIAVAYYLLLLAAFGMKLLGWHDTVLGKIAATVLISGICAVGALKGLGGRRPARDDLPPLGYPAAGLAPEIRVVAVAVASCGSTCGHLSTGALR